MRNFLYFSILSLKRIDAHPLQIMRHGGHGRWKGKSKSSGIEEETRLWGFEDAVGKRERDWSREVGLLSAAGPEAPAFHGGHAAFEV